MTPFTKEMVEEGISIVLGMSDDQLTDNVKNKLIDFMKTEHSDLEAYHFYDSIATDSCCEISQFIKTFFNVKKFYSEPNESST